MSLFSNPLVHKCTSQVWRNHIQDQETLDKYSESMKLLATSYWESSGEESRVQWVKKEVQNSTVNCEVWELPLII